MFFFNCEFSIFGAGYQALFAHQDKVGKGGGVDLCSVSIHTWFKIFEKVLYQSYYLFYRHQTCMDGAYGLTYGLKRTGTVSFDTMTQYFTVT